MPTDPKLYAFAFAAHPDDIKLACWLMPTALAFGAMCRLNSSWDETSGFATAARFS
jgi:hypothetical protein